MGRAFVAAAHNEIHGYVGKGFEAVRQAFRENFSHRKELGAACCVYHHGEKVVDLWGGVREQDNRRAVGRGHHGRGVVRHQRTSQR